MLGQPVSISSGEFLLRDSRPNLTPPEFWSSAVVTSPKASVSLTPAGHARTAHKILRSPFLTHQILPHDYAIVASGRLMFSVNDESDESLVVKSGISSKTYRYTIQSDNCILYFELFVF